MKLEFRSSNTRLINLYDRFEFKQKAILEKYYGNTDDAISMSLNLITYPVNKTQQCNIQNSEALAD